MMRARVVARTRRLHVTVTDARGYSHPLAQPLERWVERDAPSRARGTVAIALVTNARMRALNRVFRGVDKPTDVLSFPASARGLARQANTHASSRKAEAADHLGDLAIALGVAAKQARAEGHDLPTELRILALHGLLHLLGYDHERDRGTMRAVEDRLRRRAGLPAGLIIRTPSRPFHR